MTIITRFAPSPTGYLHIGGARTALFNYLFAKHHGGKFLLRIEDTDIARSTESAKQAIIDSLNWLDLKHDGEIVYQSEMAKRHVEVAKQLVALGKAYYCFTPQEEIIAMRDAAIAKGEHFIFHSKWRDSGAEQAQGDKTKAVIRLKAPREGETVVNDLLQGRVVVQNSHLDDMVLLRSDGTPTYMLAVVVDDHDMGITHIIRGDDHLSNASRQQLIYQALGWDVPRMAHISLIHGSDGAKLSKRHGALGAHEYKNRGYLPEALNNYLLRLGWSHGDDEIISREQAIKWFDIDGMGKSPARIDFDKMKHMNAHYLRQMDNEVLCKMVFENIGYEISAESKKYIELAMDSLKPRAELMNDLYDMATMFIIDKPLEFADDAKELIAAADSALIKQVVETIQKLGQFDKEHIQHSLKELAESNNMKLGELMKYVRAFIAGRTASPSVFEMIEILGKDNSIARMKQI
jgi:glutamyl-tRNA synthetase